MDEDLLASIGRSLFLPMGVDGVYARTALYEDVVAKLNALISRQRDPAAEVLRFPPVMSRFQVEQSGYLKSFPNLLACVCALHGSEGDIHSAIERHDQGGSWTTSLGATDMVLSPAACYPVYPLTATRGAIPDEGLLFDVAADCFRAEPSRSLDRLQSFRMREFVRIGAPDAIREFRDQWMTRAQQLADLLALPAMLDVASDPFFGKVGQMMAVSQRQNSLKFELLIPYFDGARATACMSFNCHLDHFGVAWGLRHEDQAVAHSSCVAFGIDRLAVALFCIHGLQPRRWPETVRQTLEL
jgi:seryl-tRNA synthetase